MTFEEKIDQQQTVYQGDLIQVERQQVTLPDATKAVREIVHHQAAVAVLMVTADQHLVLVKQWRAPANGVTLEIPAGKVEAGEMADQAAVRELNEETRLKAAHLKRVAGFYTSPGFTDEYMTLYVATGLSPVQTALPQDPDELLRLVKLDLPTAITQVAAGKLVDAKTLMAVWYWQSHPTLGAEV